MERSEHRPGDLVDIWFDPPNKDTPGWRGPAQISSINDGEGNITVRFQGRTLDRRHQEVRQHVPYFIFVATLIPHKDTQWQIVRQGAECITHGCIALGATYQQSGWHVASHTHTHDGRRLLDAALSIAHSTLHLSYVVIVSICRGIVTMPPPY